MEETPVYLFFGFMDSGKTSLIRETLFDNGFAKDLKSFLIIVCEDGDEEYSEKDIEIIGGHIARIENE